MPMLKSIKHELLAQNIVKHKGNSTKAYQETYPDASYDTANSAVFPILKNGCGVRQRVLEIIVNHSRLGIKPTLEKLAQHVDSKDERVSLTALQTAFKLQGAIPETGVVIDQSQHLTITTSQVNAMPPIDRLNKLRELLR